MNLQEETTSISSTEFNNTVPTTLRHKNQRDHNGLVTGIKYIYTEDGLVDWFSMLKPQHLYVLKDKEKEVEKKYGKSISELNLKDIDKKYLCVLLSGLRYLANLRGAKIIRQNVNNVYYDPRYEAVTSCTATCNIVWIGNFETGMQEVEYSDIAGASLISVDPFVKKYIETIAANRAFCRAVRGFLNISVVSKDEVGPDTTFPTISPEDTEISKSTKNNATDFLQKRLNEEKWSFDLFKKAVIKGHLDKFKNSSVSPEKWESIKDIPPEDVFVILGTMLSKKKAE